MTTNKNRRLISGERVLCKCSLDLPKVDPFDAMKVHRNGYMVFNTRGCSLYVTPQFTNESVGKLFKGDTPGTIKNLLLYPESSDTIKLGSVNARFLHFTDGSLLKGMVLRFVNLSEPQLDTINQLSVTLPVATGDTEENLVVAAFSDMPPDVL